MSGDKPKKPPQKEEKPDKPKLVRLDTIPETEAIRVKTPEMPKKPRAVISEKPNPPKPKNKPGARGSPDPSDE